MLLQWAMANDLKVLKVSERKSNWGFLAIKSFAWAASRVKAPSVPSRHGQKARETAGRSVSDDVVCVARMRPIKKDVDPSRADVFQV